MLFRRILVPLVTALLLLGAPATAFAATSGGGPSNGSNSSYGGSNYGGHRYTSFTVKEVVTYSREYNRSLWYSAKLYYGWRYVGTDSVYCTTVDPYGSHYTSDHHYMGGSYNAGRYWTKSSSSHNYGRKIVCHARVMINGSWLFATATYNSNYTGDVYANITGGTGRYWGASGKARVHHAYSNVNYVTFYLWLPTSGYHHSYA